MSRAEWTCPLCNAISEALVEYAESVAFYEDRADGLGREFFEEVERVLRLIGERPGGRNRSSSTSRRCFWRTRSRLMKTSASFSSA